MNTTSSSFAFNGTTPGYDPIAFTYIGYRPTDAPAAVFLGIFLIAAFANLALTVIKKTWFMIPLVVGCFLEVIGLIFRLVSPSQPNSLIVFVLYYIPILVAPTILAIPDYAMASKLMQKAKMEKIWIIKPVVIRYLFLAVDVSSFLIQCLGGGVLATATSKPENAKTGSAIILFGVAVALAVFFFFLFMTLVIHINVRKQLKPTGDRVVELTTTAEAASGSTPPHPADDSRWKIMFYLLYFHMIMLTIRSGYRVAEYAVPGFHNYVSTNEGLFFGLDILLMALVGVTWIPFHPGYRGFEGGNKVKSEDT